ncbi:MAG: hypothetical protein ABW168_08235 [Sedimenticola sp.]
MKKLSTVAIAGVLTANLGVAYATSGTTQLQAVENAITLPNTDENQAIIAEEAARVSSEASNGLSADDALDSSNKIFLSHNLSLIQEALYNMEKIAPYSNYINALRLEKLSKTKLQKERLNRGEVTKSNFKDEVEKIDRIHDSERVESAQFLENKGDRLRGICTNLNENNQAIADNQEVLEGRALPRSLTSQIRKLESTKIWQQFHNNQGSGQKVRLALSRLPDGSDGIVFCLDNLFSSYTVKHTGKIWSTEAIRSLGSN